jgi:two-component system, NtrC family, sensor histidine kinase PilS
VKSQGPGNVPIDPLVSRLQWLIFFRAVVVTLLLGATVVFQLLEGPLSPIAPTKYLYFLIGITYALTLIYALILRRIKHLKIFAYVQIMGDVVFVTLLIFGTGGIDSIFSWAYLLAIFSAAIILYRRGGLLVASASSILYGALLDLQYYQVLLPVGVRFSSPSSHPSSYVFYLIAINMVAFYSVALLSAYLSEQVRRKEEELTKRLIDFNQLERLYKHIVQNVTSGLVTVDGAGRITSFNRMAEEITGYKLEEIYQEEIRNLFPKLAEWSGAAGPSDPRWEKIRFSRWETKFQRKDGATLSLGFSLSPLKDSRDQEIGNILIFQDLTKLREMEESLKRADRLAAIGKLAAGMAHEIRNPLASISGSIEILKEEGGSVPRNHQLMNIVLREINRLNSLIEDFLLFARPTSPIKEPIHLNSIWEEVLRVFRHSPDCDSLIRLHTSFQEELSIQGDAQQIKQVFWNLLTNAAQAMPQGGDLWVNLRRNVPSAPGNGPQGEISIQDTGAGISESEVERIFDPFFTTKERGTGLGLSIVHRIVESHGGKISVTSQPGKGTTFTVLFPLITPSNH